MKKRWLWAGAGVLVLAGLGGAMITGVVPVPGLSAAAKSDADAGQRGGKKEGKDKKPDVPLEFAAREIVQPAMAQLPTVVEFSGPLVAPQTAQVRAKAGGTLLALSASEGSHVQAGQALGRIDMAELASRVAERQAQLESARAGLVQAERTHASNERLASQQFISTIALDNSRSAVNTARAQLDAAQAALDTLRLAQRDATILAPISGIVAKRHVLAGEKVSAEQLVFTIVNLARLELAGNVGTHEVAQLRPGLAVQVQVEGMARPVDGRLARIAPAAEPGTRSIGVTVEIDNPQETLRAGQYGVARAVLVDTTERLTLPASAISSSSGQAHVWVIEGGVLARRAVTLGRRNERESRVEVLQGVTPDSQVLAARFDNLKEGAKALRVAAKAAPVASAAASTPLRLN